MTFFYKCLGCGKILGFGRSGKGGIHLIRCYGECCYDIQEEANEINDWRIENGLDAMDFEGNYFKKSKSKKRS